MGLSEEYGPSAHQVRPLHSTHALVLFQERNASSTHLCKCSRVFVYASSSVLKQIPGPSKASQGSGSASRPWGKRQWPRSSSQARMIPQSTGYHPAYLQSFAQTTLCASPSRRRCRPDHSRLPPAQFPAFDQIVNEAAKYRFRSGGQNNVRSLTFRSRKLLFVRHELPADAL